MQLFLAEEETGIAAASHVTQLLRYSLVSEDGDSDLTISNIDPTSSTRNTYKCVALLLMELATGGSLSDYLRREKRGKGQTDARLSLPQLEEIIPQIAKAVEEVHLRGVFHSDIKPDNLLLYRPEKTESSDSNHNESEAAEAAFGWHIKISDFGLSRLASASGCVDVILTRAGTVLFMAPEMVHPGSHNNPFRVGRPADVWGMGVIFYLLLFGDYPLKNLCRGTVSEILCNIKHLSWKIRYRQKFSRWIQGLKNLEANDKPKVEPEAETSTGLRKRCLNLILVARGCLKVEVP